MQPNSATQSSTQLKAYVALISVVVIWGFAPALIRSFSLLVSAQDALFIRLVSVGLLCMLLLPLSGFYIARHHWLRLVLVSCLGMFGYFFGSIFGFVHVTSGMGGLLMAMQPLIIAAMAAAIGSEKLSVATLIGFAVSLAGTAYMVMSKDSNSATTAALNPWLGTAYILGCGVAFSGNVVFSKPLIQAYGPFRVTVWVMIFTALPALAFFRPSALEVLSKLDIYAWASLFYLGPIGTIFAVVLWNGAVGKLPPTTVGASLYVIPLLAILSGWLLLGEPATIHTAIAAAIILSGVAIAEYGKQIRSLGVWTGA